MFIVVTGASASGKSEYAEKRIMELTPKSESAIYIATMQPYGDEGRARVEKHRRQRAQRRFETREIYLDMETAEIPKGKNILLECMSNLAANEMFARQEPQSAAMLKTRIIQGIQHLLDCSENFVAVTNEVFSDTMQYDTQTLAYIGLLGEINQALAVLADEVIEVVYGIPVFIKGGSKA